jgi:hypothetical protein
MHLDARESIHFKNLHKGINYAPYLEGSFLHNVPVCMQNDLWDSVHAQYFSGQYVFFIGPIA